MTRSHRRHVSIEVFAHSAPGAARLAHLRNSCHLPSERLLNSHTSAVPCLFNSNKDKQRSETARYPGPHLGWHMLFSHFAICQTIKYARKHLGGEFRSIWSHLLCADSPWAETLLRLARPRNCSCSTVSDERCLRRFWLKSCVNSHVISTRWDRAMPHIALVSGFSFDK